MCLMWQDDLGPCHVSGGEGMLAAGGKFGAI